MTVDYAAMRGKRLSDREVEILTAVSLGMANKQIATRFLITEATAAKHLSNIAAKLGTRGHNRVLMVRRGFIEGYLRIPARDGDIQDRIGA